MKTLLLVDVQNDFMPGGSLAVEKGDEIVPFINEIIESYDLVVATQDWHPNNHKSFASQHSGKAVFDVIDLNGIDQVLWPDHCVQGTKGAEFHPDLNIRPIDVIFRKGTNEIVDSYSAFYDNHRLHSTCLAEYLKAKGVETIDVVGLAGDYCVFYTIKDALDSGFSVRLIDKGVRSINPEEYSKIKQELNQNPSFEIID